MAFERKMFTWMAMSERMYRYRKSVVKQMSLFSLRMRYLMWDEIK